MKKELINGILAARAVIIKQSPTILSGLAVTGLVTSMYLTHRATIDAQNKLEEEDLLKATWQEKAKATWKIYAAPVAMGTVTAACIVGSNVISLKRMAALTSLYSISETALREYQAKTGELLGDKKVETIQTAVAKDRMDKTDPEYIELTSKGEDLCFDAHTGRYFRSSISAIKEAVASLNLRLIGDMRVSLNDLYYELGLDGIPSGDDVGWSIDIPLDVRYDSHLRSDGKPCLVMRFKNEPFLLYCD